MLPRHPIPVIMISSLQLQEGNEVFRALELGAVDYVQKPVASELSIVGPLIREKVRMALSARVGRSSSKSGLPRLALPLPQDLDLTKVVAIGAPTGGTEAIKEVLLQLPPEIPPVVIVQHIPSQFSKAFAIRLNDLCPFTVKEAEDGDEVEPSKVLIAPGGRQMKLVRSPSGSLVVRVTDDPPVKRHKPSVDYLFASVAEIAQTHAIGIILTGMGDDGADGLLRMRKAGAYTLAQNEESCVVYGMPRAAFEKGAVEKVLPLESIPAAILDAARRRRSA